jgi:predicted permease
MSARSGPPVVLRWIVRRAVPEERRDDVLGDLEATIAEREARLGKRAANRLLWKEALSLLVWRARSLHAPGWAGDAGSDLRFAARALARRPAFALTAVGVLALGIGSVTTVLTLVERIYFDPPSEVVEPHRLVRIYRAWRGGPVGGSLAHSDYMHYRAGSTTLAGVAAYDGGRTDVAYASAPGEADEIGVSYVSDNYFDVLGVRPALGRFFLPEEDSAPGTHLVAVMSHAFWRTALGAAPGALGRTVTLNGHPFTVVGVAPERFRGASPIDDAVDAWVPISTYGLLAKVEDMSWWERVPNSSMNWLTVIGRLAAGATPEAAEANLGSLSRALQYQGRDSTEYIALSEQYLYGPGQADTLATLSKLLLAAVAIVLVIALANVSVLALMRTATRGSELAIRNSVGASRGRIVRLILAESLLLGLAGGALGVGLAFVAGDVVASLLPFRFATSFTPDARVAAGAFLLALLAATAVGLSPALQIAPTNAPSGRRRYPDLKEVIEGGRHARAGTRLRDALVVGQVALSLVLVAGAALFSRSFLAARGEDLGFASENRLLLTLDLRSQGYDPARGSVFVRDAIERLEALPGVVRASTTTMVPFQGEWTTEMDTPAGARATEPNGKIVTGSNVVGPGYFEVMGIPIVSGRALGDQDVPGSPPVTVINQALARALWPGEDAVGKTLPIRKGVDFTVVGVAADATYYELGEQPRAQAYGSLWQAFMDGITFVVQTEGPAVELASQAQAVFRDIDPALVFDRVESLESVLGDQVARYRVTASLVGIFGALALLLATGGLYALVAYLVASRTREIGLRMVLGADRARVAADVLARAVLLAAVGVALGLAGALATRRFTASLLYEIAPEDPVPLVIASATLLLVAALAALGPARRAMRVSPMDSLRAE